MHRVQLHYALLPEGGPARLNNPLFDLLGAIHVHGSISGAAKALKLSYRHVWGELKKWELALGQSLVIWEKGRPAQLTVFGSKLMWAERQTQARLMPQISALLADLDRVFAIAFDDNAHILTLYASHDPVLALLSDFGRERRLHLDIRFAGSVDAIRALNEGRCGLAGFHVRRGLAIGSLTQQTFKPLLRPGKHKLIGLARRTQGLMVARGNPLNLHTLNDVSQRNARFSNRTLGTGTRVLVDELLLEAGICSPALRGYQTEEHTQAAVAQAIASGASDVGIGTAATAQHYGLDHIPLVEEHYYLACLKSSLGQASTQALLAALESEAWMSRIGMLTGYQAYASGKVLAMSKELPWWQFRRSKH